MATILVLGCIASLAGCRDAAAAPARCDQYPIPWRSAAGAQSAAQQELASMAPGASMTWNGNTGTFTAALPLSTPLSGCTDGQDVIARVFAILAAHPALFQLDLSEWRTPEPFDCKYLGDNEILNIGRRRLAGHPVAKDVFAYSLKRINGVPYLTGVNGTYLPVLGAAMGDSMTACNTLTEAAATATARHTKLGAGVYSQCQRTGTVTYAPKARDALGFSSGESWDWQDGTGEVLLTGQRTLRVVVDPSNYTPDLLSSDARCPVPDGDGDAFTVGFDIVFDIHTGAILSIKPGLDCVVC